MTDFLKLFDSTGFVLVESAEEGQIDAAVERYLSTGETVDTLLCLTLLSGEVYKTRASAIVCWYSSTPAQRARGIEIDKALEDERRANRRSVGFIESE